MSSEAPTHALLEMSRRVDPATINIPIPVVINRYVTRAGHGHRVNVNCSGSDNEDIAAFHRFGGRYQPARYNISIPQSICH